MVEVGGRGGSTSRMQKDGYVNVAPVLLMIGRLQVSCRVCLMWRRSSGGVPVNPLAYAPCNAGQLPCLFDLEAQGKLQHAPAPRVAAFMSARSKTPYITLVWIFLWEWGSTGAQGAAAGICLEADPNEHVVLGQSITHYI